MKKRVRKYLGSIVLGLNDALVELIGALSGLTLALQNSKIIVISGLITGIAASLSMGASEYLSTKAETFTKKNLNKKNPITAASYTSLAYFATVLFLIFPYLILANIYYSLAWALLNGVIVIFVFTHYAYVEKGHIFQSKFLEMLFISFGVAIISFGFGYLIRIIFGVEV